MFNGNGGILQESDYYPFGMQFNSTLGGENKYLFNSKELQDEQLGEINLDLYDYGARFFDPMLGRWHVVDPLSENNIHLSPYNYSINNPIRYVDPDGNHPWDVTNTARSFIGTWYEWGGKNPYFVGGMGLTQMQGSGVGGWVKFSYDWHKKTYKSLGYMIPQSFIYQMAGLNVPDGYSVGMDCSALSKHSFNADPHKLMPDLPDGSRKQYKAFKDAQGNGTGLLHSDFQYIMEGDLVFSTYLAEDEESGSIYRTASHVMVATGEVDVDKNGNIIAFEVIHASATGTPVGEPTMIGVRDDHRIGHTYRYQKIDLMGPPIDESSFWWPDEGYGFWIINIYMK